MTFQEAIHILSGPIDTGLNSEGQQAFIVMYNAIRPLCTRHSNSDHWFENWLLEGIRLGAFDETDTPKSIADDWNSDN